MGDSSMIVIESKLQCISYSERYFAVNVPEMPPPIIATRLSFFASFVVRTGIM